MLNPLVSIIMPVRNADPYLQDCLDSIFNQSYSNFELIVINDHSSDKSMEILLENKSRFNQVKILENEGEGIIEALNTGYEHINGEFVTRMDADDLMPSKKLELLLRALQNAGSNHVATGLVKYFKEGDLGDGYQKYEVWLNDLTKRAANFQDRYKECVIPSPSWMTSKEDFDRIGGFKTSRYPEDYDLAFRMFQGNLKVAGVNELCHLWRDHDRRASRNDSNYANNNFLDLKLHYFLLLDYKTSFDLVLWGAGKKGKFLAQRLVQEGIPFKWICDNPKKIGKHIYGKLIQEIPAKEQISLTCQFIIAVANSDSQISINQTVSKFESYFFA